MLIKLTCMLAGMTRTDANLSLLAAANANNSQWIMFSCVPALIIPQQGRELKAKSVRTPLLIHYFVLNILSFSISK